MTTPDSAAPTLRESFAADNPWVPILTGLRRRPGMRRAGGGVTLLLGLLALLLVGWFLAFAYGTGVTRVVASVHYLAALSLAMLAPALGSSARRRLDYHSLLPEALTTPIPRRQYLAALHGAIALRCAAAAAFGATLIAALSFAIWKPEVPVLLGIRQSALHPFLWFLKVYDLLRMLSPWGIQGGPGTAKAGMLGPLVVLGIAVLVTSANYAGGVYWRATCLAARSQRDPQANVAGSVLTGWLVATAMGFFAARTIGLQLLLKALGQSDQTWFYAFLLCEAGMAAARFVRSRRLWGRILVDDLRDTESFLSGGDEVANCNAVTK